MEAVRNRADVSGLQPDQRDIITFVRQLLQKNWVEQQCLMLCLAATTNAGSWSQTATVGQCPYISAINNAIVVSIGTGGMAFDSFFKEGATKILGWYLEAVAGRGLAVTLPGGRKVTAKYGPHRHTVGAILHSIDITGFVRQE
jgi:hypothetical protein